MTVMVSNSEDVSAALRAAVERLDPTTRIPVAYHFGWCDRVGNPVVVNSGKSMRSRLTLLAARAPGGSTHAAVSVAVAMAMAVELVHNCALLHDDLMDRDRTRRHRATVWSLWGKATAVLAGDALLSLAHEVLAESGSPFAVDASRVIATATRESIRGQAQDMAFEQRNDVTVAECIAMAEAKTAGLITACGVGGLLAGADSEVIGSLERYGRHSGVAFHVADDLLGIWSDPQLTGKPAFSDLRSAKKSLPVTWTLCHGGTAGRELADWLMCGERDEDGLCAAAALVEAGGGRAWARAEAEPRLPMAVAALDHPAIDTQSRCELEGFARRLVNRRT
jgi:geranylgeranyl diphosphate synthase, type I